MCTRRKPGTCLLVLLPSPTGMYQHMSWLDRWAIEWLLRLSFQGSSPESACSQLTNIDSSHWRQYPEQCYTRLAQQAWSNAATFQGLTMLTIMVSMCALMSCCRPFSCLGFGSKNRRRRRSSQKHEEYDPLWIGMKGDVSPRMKLKILEAAADYHREKIETK